MKLAGKYATGYTPDIFPDQQLMQMYANQTTNPELREAALDFQYPFKLSDLKNSGLLTSNRSIVIATYSLCGFANFASIGIQIGGIGGLAPSQQSNLAKFGIKALIGGTIAALMTATIAGMLIG